MSFQMIGSMRRIAESQAVEGDGRVSHVLVRIAGRSLVPANCASISLVVRKRRLALDWTLLRVRRAESVGIQETAATALRHFTANLAVTFRSAHLKSACF